MKKLTFAAVALLAIAGLASAEEFGITMAGVNLTLNSAQNNCVTLPSSEVTIAGKIASSTGSRVSINSWVWEGDTLSFDVAIADGYTLTALSLGGTIRAGGSSAPTSLAWTVSQGNTVVFGSNQVMPGYATTDNFSYTDAISGLNLSGNVTIGLRAVGVATFNNEDRSSTRSWYTAGNINVFTTTFTGTVTKGETPTQIPEPATLSLLGLGAMAFVLRRKLRK